jgi:membrane protein YqaA with SNARE-associated domain
MSLLLQFDNHIHLNQLEKIINVTGEISPRLQFQDIFNWLASLSLQYGYFGIFLISLLGAASIFFPVPDSAILFALAGSSLFNPLLLSVAATVGGTVGEFSGYLLGFSGRKTITKCCEKNIELFSRLFNRYGTLAIFLFALTPLPDDLVFIPLGILRYNVVKTFLPAFIGKLLLNLGIVYGGVFFVDFIGDAVGLTNDWLPALLSTVLGVVVFILMLTVDWQKYLGKYFAQTHQAETNSKIAVRD